MLATLDIAPASVAGGVVTSYLIHVDPSTDEWVDIPSFNVGDRYWRMDINYYSNRVSRLVSKSKSTVHMSIDLTLDGRVAKPITAQVTASLLDQDGEPVPDHSVCTGTRDYSQVGHTYGCRLFINKEILEACSVSANCFIVACHVFVYKVSPLFDLPQPQHILDADFDVRFRVGGETFGAHRCVLAARSPVLEAELYKGATAGASCTQIDDMLPEVFASLLWFIYTDCLPPTKDAVEEAMMTEHLLAAADRFSVEELKLICEEKLFRELNHDTAAKILKLAIRHRSSFLREACIDFLEEAPCLEAAMAMDDGLCEHVAKFYPVLLKNMWVYEEDPMQDELAMCL
ncbi:hypothetical protein U9M48_009563 [Paspalum notatum var. saurae]|uniref:BTB domain-containing protein n=1 Tax=Paspalum notatum var. saurae TaxID=547442 RepID=A0AAQ3SSW3_PASNO